ncbi:unnamed protein product [Eruca vesicaria subsp. sativa]|uniref:C2H2-type domain-containing protein n=1 Tax=Eruca vesicaria subsp. sativa TaxID=29727 RepID=A0ABC8LUK0_ERUVS|nr:unnamed protein product [Eruca vesicaria subsp. sativa]
MMENDNIIHICDTCERRFSTLRSLHCHQRVHTRDEELEMQLKKTKPSNPPGQGTSNSVDLGGYSQNPLSNDMYRWLSRDPVESISVENTPTFPILNSGDTDVDRNTSYGFSSGTLFVTHNHNHPNFDRLGIPVGHFKSGGGGSSRDYPYSLFNGGITTMAPHATPYRSLTSYDSSSRSVPLPSYSWYNNSHAFSLDHSLGSANSTGSFSNKNETSSSQDSLSLELTLGPSNSMGGTKINSSAYPSLNDGVTGEETRNMNTLVRPLVSRFRFHSHNPLDSIIRNVPLSHPPPTTNLPDDKNVSGSSLIAKEKDKTAVLDDDEKDNVVTVDHDEDQTEEVEAKSCSRD